MCGVRVAPGSPTSRHELSNFLPAPIFLSQKYPKKENSEKEIVTLRVPDGKYTLFAGHYR